MGPFNWLTIAIANLTERARVTERESVSLQEDK